MDQRAPATQLVRAALSWLLLLLVALAGDFSVTLAQTTARRSGIWAGIGLGYGSASATCEECNSAPATRGLTGSLSVGTGISKQLLAGIQVDAWYDRFDGGREILSSLTGTVRYYPSQTGRWFGTAGAGLSSYWSSRSWFYGVGWGLRAGAGYDLWTSGGWSLSPLLQVSFGAVGNLRSDGAVFLTGWRQRVLEAGMQFRWNGHSGSAGRMAHAATR